MGKVVYISKSSIERKRGPLRIAHLPGEPQPECSYTQSVIVRFWRSQKVTAFRNCLVLAFEQTPRNLTCLASGSRWKRRRRRLNIHQPSRISVEFRKAHSLHARISAVNPNSMSLSTLYNAVTFVRPMHLIFRRAPESGSGETRTMDIVHQKTKRQGTRL